MKKNRKKETIIINNESLENYKMLSLGLENCESFNIDIVDILDISCEIYRYCDVTSRCSDCYHTTDGYIRISGKARDILSNFSKYITKDENVDEYKLCNRMSLCDDMCVFGLLDKNDKWINIYVPYDAVETAVNHCEIDYANCPSFEILESGDMEIRFGALSKNPIMPRNNYSNLVEDWKDVLGDFDPKDLKLRVDNVGVDYLKGDPYCNVNLHCIVLNKKREGKAISFSFVECDRINLDYSGKSKKSHLFMTRLCNGNVYAGINYFFSVSCKFCRVHNEEW